MDVLDLPCDIKDNLSSLLFHYSSDTRKHGVELLSNYSSTPDMEMKVIDFSSNGRTQATRARSVFDYCESNDLQDTASYRIAWHAVSSQLYSSVFVLEEPD